MLRSKQFPKEDCGVIKLNSIEYHWIKSYFHLQHRASLAQETIASQPFIWNETMEEGRSANRNELLSRDGMNFAQQMALGVCHLGRLKTCWIKWESGSLYVVWRTVAIALELLQYSTHREAEKQFPKEAVRRAAPALERHRYSFRGWPTPPPRRRVPVECKDLVKGEGMETGTFPTPPL